MYKIPSAEEPSLADRSKLHKDAIKALDQNLGANEVVRVIIIGLWDSAIIGTDYRAFIFKKGMMGGVMFGSKLSILGLS